MTRLAVFLFLELRQVLLKHPPGLILGPKSILGVCCSERLLDIIALHCMFRQTRHLQIGTPYERVAGGKLGLADVRTSGSSLVFGQTIRLYVLSQFDCG